MTSIDNRLLRTSFRTGRRPLTALALISLAAAACGSGHNASTDRVKGQSDFQSAPVTSSSGFARGGAEDSAGASSGTGGSTSAAPTVNGSVSTTTSTPRTVEETDLYRLEGDRLYYLNGYRGLMVFDVTDVDHPKLLGRSPIFGSPVEMRVKDGIATVVVADWYGTMDDGSPFHGSIVRGIDATDPANMKMLGDAKLGGWVRDTRVVGDVLYAVSEEYGWSYGWYDAVGYNPCSDQMVVSSVSFANGKIEAKGRFAVNGYGGGVFNVTPNSIMFAHDAVTNPTANNCSYYGDVSATALDYIDISDPGGTIRPRGHLEFQGRVQGWGTDNGRWNLDFADAKIAHAIGCDGSYCGGAGSNYVLATADFTNPDAPVLASRLTIPGSGWTPAARFDSGRMYLAPAGDYYYGTGASPSTPIQVFDISVPAAPKLAGSTSITGSVWNFIPSGNRLFALGDDAYNPSVNNYGQQISLRYLDVTDPAHPAVLGASTFGQGWAWTPAAGTFKAFTKDDVQGLVVLPFSGWSPQANAYNNGLQLIEFTPTTLTTSGVANTKGWVERGIFVKNRLVSLSNLALSVVDYTNHAKPTVVNELTLARNVVDARPAGTTIAQVSTDWWGNDQDHSELRVLPIDQADEKTTDPTLLTLDIEGTNARVFHNGPLSYVVSDVRTAVDCATLPGYTSGSKPGDPSGASAPCYVWHQQVQIVDLSNGTAVKKGKVELPSYGNYNYWYGGWGWEGCYYYDWFWGGDILQVGGDALAFRRWYPNYAPNGAYVDALDSLFVVDLSNPDNPTVGATRIVDDPLGWWGDMRAIGNTLYTTHYEWVAQPSWGTDGRSYDPGVVRYYLDQIDLTDRSQPKVGARINVPGILVGGSDTDSSILYTIDYRWYYGDNRGANEFDVLKIDGSRAYLQGSVQIPGWVGNTFIQNDHAYMSVQHYADEPSQQPYVQLWQLDLRSPEFPVAQPAPGQKGWGWLLGVEGDRALVTSGWGSNGLDVYRLSDSAPPAYDRFVRTVGWGANAMSRQDNRIFLSSGYWGVQTVDVTP